MNADRKTTDKKTVALIIVLMFLGMFIGNYGQYQLAAVPSLVYQKLNLNDSQFSSLMTGPMVPAIFLSIVAGVLTDKFGVNKTITVCYAITAVGFVIRAVAGTFTLTLIGMILMGFGNVGLNVNLSKIVASLCPIEKVGKICGVLLVGATLSMTVAYSTTAYFPSLDAAFWTAAIASIVILVLWVALIRDRYFAGAQSSGMTQEPVKIKQALSVSLKNYKVWCMGLALLFVMGGTMVIANFQVAALSALKGYSEAYAGTFSSVGTIGCIIGTVVFPFLLGNMKKPGIVLGLCELAAGLLVVGCISLPAAGIYFASFANGFLRSGVITILFSYPVMFKEIGPKYAGTAGGVAMTLELLGAVLIPTYVIVPLGGGNMTTYFVLGMVSMCIAAVFCFITGSGVEKDRKAA